MSEWISVKDRMPRLGQDCIVYKPRWFNGTVAIERCYNGGKRGPTFDGHNKGTDYYHVSHWMPLPNPPSERSDDDRPSLLGVPIYFTDEMIKDRGAVIRAKDEGNE